MIPTTYFSVSSETMDKPQSLNLAIRCSLSRILLVFSRLVKKPGIIPVCRKCTALATPIRTANLSDQLRTFLELFSAHKSVLQLPKKMLDLYQLLKWSEKTISQFKAFVYIVSINYRRSSCAKECQGQLVQKMN